MDYFRKATTTSPAVIMDSRYKSALIKGSSICKNTDVYAQVTSDIKRQLERSEYTDINMQFEVFNTRAAKSILDILKSIKNKKNNTPRVHWLCDRCDKEMMEMGKDVSELLEIDIDVSCS